MKKKTLLMLVDDRRYIRANCYQRQLAEVLESEYDVRMISLREIKYLPWANPKKYDRVLSVLRLRTLNDNLDVVARFLKDTRLHIYEQDIWYSYMDDSPWKGAYGRIHSRLNVASFLVTTKWWTDFAAQRGIPAQFVRMGMLPRYCEMGPAWEDRPIPLGFQGTVHPHRKAFYDALEGMGFPVDVLKSVPYEGYLENLHKMRIYIHTEEAPWRVNGQIIPRNALWIKDTEVAARGTFAIRDYEEESKAYGISELPTIYTYRKVSDIPSMIDEINHMSPKARAERMRASVETMRKRNDWMTVVRAIEATSA
ncbi:MAG: hypothetical protein WC521_01945 [Bdellovibrionales bacterium]